jgi:hypothetical protein
MTRAGAVGQRSDAASRARPAAMTARLAARSGAPVPRRVTRPVAAQFDQA